MWERKRDESSECWIAGHVFALFFIKKAHGADGGWWIDEMSKGCLYVRWVLYIKNKKVN